MARAGKQTIDPAEALQARAAKDIVLAEILRVLHERLRLWRLCTNSGCKRARGCCGDAVACGARRWPNAKALLRQGPAAGRRADWQVLQRPDTPEAHAGVRKVIFQWRDASDAKA